MTATMRISTPLAPPVPRPSPIAAARLRLLPPRHVRPGETRRPAGAWWPRSRDLARELPALIAGADLSFGRIERVTVNSSMWPDPPSRVAVAGRTVRVGRFPAGYGGAEVCVVSNAAGRWDLLVVPPERPFTEADPLEAAAYRGRAQDGARSRAVTAHPPGPEGPTGWTGGTVRA